MRIALALLAALQVGRLVVFLFQPGFVAGAAVPTTGVRHVCLAAYLRAAELAADDPDALYQTAPYQRGESRVPGLAPHLSDPFQYPPTALPLPALAVASGAGFDTIRLVWFFLQAAAFAGLAWWLAPSRWPLLAVAASFPVLVNFQFGQVHLLTLALGAAAWALFQQRRDRLGGLALALAIGLKLFPAILLIPLLRRRRFAALGWTALGLAGLAGIAFIAYGTAPFVHFVREQLPALASGEAFAVFREEPAFRFSNLGVASLADKLALPAWTLTIPYAILLIVLASRLETGALGLLTLASFASGYAPAGYVMAGTIWLLAGERPRPLVILIWLFLAVQPFVYSFPLFWRLPVLLAVLAIAAQLLAVGLGIRAAIKGSEPG